MAAPGTEERRLAGGTLAMLACLALAATAVGWIALGWYAALSALIGVAFVAVLFGASALALAWSAARGSGTGVGLLVGGALGRLVLYAVALSGLGQLEWVHRTSLALAIGASVAITLAYELRSLARRPRLFFIDAQPGRPRVDPPAATRSQTL